MWERWGRSQVGGTSLLDLELDVPVGTSSWSCQFLKATAFLENWGFLNPLVAESLDINQSPQNDPKGPRVFQNRAGQK